MEKAQAHQGCRILKKIYTRDDDNDNNDDDNNNNNNNNNKDSSLRGGSQPSRRSVTVKNFDTFF